MSPEATPSQTPSGPVVSFTRMEDGTREVYELLSRLEGEFAADTADRILARLRQLSDSVGGYQFDRLEHSLQSATRDRNARDRHRDHRWYQDAVDFSYRWGPSSFDPDYEAGPLEFFEPMVRRIFAREPFSLWPRGRS